MPKKTKQLMSREQAERARTKIQAGKLIDRVQRFALGQPGHQGEKIDLNARQLKAALALIDKCLPNLHSTEYTNTTERRKPEEIQAQLAAIVENLDQRTFAQLQGMLKPVEPIEVIPEQVEH